MNLELLTVCVGLVGMTAVAVWALSRCADRDCTIVEQNERIACLRFDRDTVLDVLVGLESTNATLEAENDALRADNRRLTELHRIDPNTTIVTRNRELEAEVAGALELLQAETAARVAAQNEAAVAAGDLKVLTGYLDSEIRGVELARKILADTAADTACEVCGDTDDPGLVVWPDTGCLTQCDACGGTGERRTEECEPDPAGEIARVVALTDYGVRE